MLTINKIFNAIICYNRWGFQKLFNDSLIRFKSQNSSRELIIATPKDLTEKRPRKSLKKLKQYHKWTALIISFFLLIFAVSGIVLNHRTLFSRIDVNRKWLPSEYRYENWNLSAVKSTVHISGDSVLVYGNIGIWLTDSGFKEFTSFNDGLPEGIDNRRISGIFLTKAGHIYAGSLSGLYMLNREAGRWEVVGLPGNESRIVGITQKYDSIYVMTRSKIFSSADKSIPEFAPEILPPALDESGKETLFRTLWLIHSGKIFGTAGKLVVDLMAVVLVYLILSGILFTFTPGMLRKISAARARSGLKKANRFSIKWHNSLGYTTFIFLTLITLTGMFLRPPLLIPIARINVPVIKNSWLDNPNPWFDKLRDIIWDDDLEMFIYSTSRGIYYSGPSTDTNLHPFPVQPPVSVMGINVFEKNSSGGYIVGSFSGIYRWFPEAGLIFDHITGLPHQGGNGLSSPFGNVPISGRMVFNNNEILFDYMNGAFSIRNDAQIPEMPDNIIESSPMSLWNLALEVHTGRIFFPLIGNFYILYIPLMGISTLVVLVSGFLIWWRKLNRSKNR
jgi:hypothetical protein